MSDLNKVYDPTSVEERRYADWMNKGFFRSVPDEREPFTIVIPPPNVTGVLHMGHMLNNTIQDVLIRRARMLGKNACWVPGTDHASIATEAKVVQMLRTKGIKKSDLSREEFMQYAWEWKEKHGGIILDQLKKLGASCDWERTSFTMDPDYYNAVIDIFIDLYDKGLIYRGWRMIHWDPAAKTTISNEEVIYKEVDSALYHIAYDVCDAEGNETGEKITIATTRPETIPADTAICVNPTDARFTHLHGKFAKIPLIGRVIPVITDEYVDPEFGTGCLKVTPAHDVNDYELGKKHGLPILNIMHEDGTLNADSILFEGKDRFDARKEMVRLFKESGHLIKQENLKNKIGFSERTDAVVEPRLSLQWFLEMKKLAGPALEVVNNGTVKFWPPKFSNTYRHWMENVTDWCLSRQLWWGHRIPAWYLKSDSEIVTVAKTAEEAAEKLAVKIPGVTAADLRQEDDVLDTWASSWLWPIAVFDGFKNPDNREITYYYPTNDLVTAPEIMFFWVARMIMAGLEYRGEVPFRNVYYTGIVRDKSGRKMSKSLGNSPDPIDLIKKYGADGVRVGMLLSSPAGNDLLFDESLCEQGRNFTNKIWNSYRLIAGWTITQEEPDSSAVQAMDWFRCRMASAIQEINEHYAQFRVSDALMATYKLFWDDFCAIYLELIKPKGGAVAREVMETTLGFFEDLLKLLHPFVPFISEELWHQVRERKDKEYLICAPWPSCPSTLDSASSDMDFALELVTALRNFRNEKSIPFREVLTLYASQIPAYGASASKLANLAEFQKCTEKPAGSITLLVKATEFYISAGEHINPEEEAKKIRKDLEYYRGFEAGVQKKLANERFVQQAKPEVVETERRKLAEAEAKIKSLEEQLAALGL
jgi:valyl-tRNA synthetase